MKQRDKEFIPDAQYRAEVEVEAKVVDASADEKKAKEREKARVRKAEQRKRDKAKREVAEAKKNEAKLATLSNEEWFATNRATLTPAQRAELEARGEETLMLEVLMAEVITARRHRLPESDWGDYDGYEYCDEMFDPAYVKKLVQRVEAHVEKNGTYLDGTMRENIAQYRGEQFAKWSLGDRATAETLTYGYLLGVGSKILNHFRIVTSPEGYRHECATCRSVAYQRAERRPPPDWRCPSCEQKHREKVAMVLDNQRQQEKAIAASDIIYDQFGRVKNQ